MSVSTLLLSPSVFCAHSSSATRMPHPPPLCGPVLSCSLVIKPQSDVAAFLRVVSLCRIIIHGIVHQAVALRAGFALNSPVPRKHPVFPPDYEPASSTYMLSTVVRSQCPPTASWIFRTYPPPGPQPEARHRHTDGGSLSAPTPRTCCNHSACAGLPVPVAPRAAPR